MGRYYLIAGEASGDLHGSNLIRGLLAADPQAEIRCWGGALMAAAGGELSPLRRVIGHIRGDSVRGGVGYHI